MGKPTRSRLVWDCKIDGVLRDDLATYITTLKDAPIYVLREEGIMPDYLEGEQAKFLKIALRCHKAEMEWVERYQFDRTDLLPELTLTNKVNSRPGALISLAHLKICQIVYEKDPSGWVQAEYQSAGHLWFSCKMAQAREGLKAGGLIGSPQRVGKVQHFKDTSQQIEELQENIAKLTSAFVAGDMYDDALSFTEFECKYPDRELRPIETLMDYASQIAANPLEISFRKELEDQLKIIKRCTREHRENKQVQHCGLDEQGKLWISGKHKRGQGKPKRSKKGFSKEM